MKVDFTEEELYTIERTFDNLAWISMQEHSKWLSTIQKFSENKKIAKHINKSFDEVIDGYDVMRTISAKCQRVMRKKQSEIKENGTRR